VVIGYFDEAHETDKETFSKVSEALGHGYKFGYTTDNDVITKSKYSGSAVFVYKPVSVRLR
jgi:hypothetical protein